VTNRLAVDCTPITISAWALEFLTVKSKFFSVSLQASASEVFGIDVWELAEIGAVAVWAFTLIELIAKRPTTASALRTGYRYNFCIG